MEQDEDAVTGMAIGTNRKNETVMILFMIKSLPLINSCQFQVLGCHYELVSSFDL